MNSTLTPEQKNFFEGHGVNPSAVKPNLLIDRIYSIYDVCTGSFEAPFLAPNDRTSMRIVNDNLLFRDTLIKRHPEDYQLFIIGEFYKDSGEIVPMKPVKVINLSDLLVPNNKSTPACADDLDNINT